MRQTRLRRYGHVKRRGDDYVDRKVPEMQLPAGKKTGKIKEEVFGGVH